MRNQNESKRINKKVTYSVTWLFLLLSGLHSKRNKMSGSKVIERLTYLIEKYPGVPQLKNFLSAAYMNSNNIKKATYGNLFIMLRITNSVN
ncbi:MAG: hypothetical protein A2Y71_07545 [Bacteroidetes bacterium RBG_13_42_15]|nr:MAG: hypothetical protein A2Y71_07545 [Bacteroidetes bacterium RBG_13_42_15]